MPVLALDASLRKPLGNATSTISSISDPYTNMPAVPATRTEVLAAGRSSISSFKISNVVVIAITVYCSMFAAVLVIYVGLRLYDRKKRQRHVQTQISTPESTGSLSAHEKATSQAEDLFERQNSGEEQILEERRGLEEGHGQEQQTSEEDQSSISVIDAHEHHPAISEPPHPPSAVLHPLLLSDLPRCVNSTRVESQHPSSRPLPATPPPLYLPPSPPQTPRSRRQLRPRTRRIARDGGLRIGEGDGVPSAYRAPARTRSVVTIASGMTENSTPESTDTLPPPYGRPDSPERNEPHH